MSEGRGRVRTGGYVGFADLPNQVCQHSTSDDVTFRVVTSLTAHSESKYVYSRIYVLNAFIFSSAIIFCQSINV